MEHLWSKEWRTSNFLLNHDDPKVFISSRWQTRDCVSGRFLYYRCLVALWSFSILVSSFVHEHDKETAFDGRSFLAFWFIYPTNLTFVCLTLHLVVSFVVLTQHLLQTQNDGARPKMTGLVKVSWVLYNTVTMASFAITIGYWSAIYSPEVAEDVLSIVKHGLNSLVVLVDVLVSARPYRLLHFYQPLSAVVGYMTFTLVYWSLGGRSHQGSDHINTFCDWANFDAKWPGLFALLLVFPVQVLIWLLHVLRDWLHQRWCAGRTRFADGGPRYSPPSAAAAAAAERSVV